MQRARVGAMPQPKQYDQGRKGGNRPRVQSGMSLEELKAQTANRLALEKSDGGDESSHNVRVGATSADQTTATIMPMHYPPHPQGHQYPREHTIHYGSPQNAMHYPHPRSVSRDYGPPPPQQNFGYGGEVPNSYSSESSTRNYTDSQLGIAGGPSTVQQQQQQMHNMPPQWQSPPHPPNYRSQQQPLQKQQQQQQYSTPRMPRHATVLKDRGSAENSVGSDPSGGSGNGGIYGYENRGNARFQSPAIKGNRVGSHNGKNIYKAASAAKPQPPQEIRAPDGRHTPTREHHVESQVLFTTPNRMDVVPSTPSSVYSEPPRNKHGGNRSHPTAMSPNYNRMRSPDHHAGGNHSRGGNNKNQLNKHQQNQQNNQSKLPHGLTVQELKEMTRARLAAEADVPGGEGVVSSDQSVHSVGTHETSKGSGCNLGHSNESVTRNLLHSNNSVRFQGQQQQQQMAQHQHPRHPSPVFGAGRNQHFNGNQPQQAARQPSPAVNWECAMPFSTPSSDSNNAVKLNRGRCLSAEATTGGMPSSFEQHQTAYYDHVPLTGTANRQRCATTSPPGMSRLHEDRPFLFSNDDKERLAIPPLSEPRLRLHSTGGLNTHGTAMRAFASSVSPPPTNDGSAFVSVSGKRNEQFLPQSPPHTTSSANRSKFGVGDRTISTGSASGHGDLPLSMAEAVLESITSTSMPNGGIQMIGTSPFHSSEQGFIGESPYRVSESSDNTSSAFRLPGLTESSGSASLFSSGESHNIFSTEKSSGDRMLLGTQSWGGADDEGSSTNMGLSHDFSNLLKFADGEAPPARGRAATEPVWLGGGNDFVSRIDPEHNAERKGPPRVSSLVDTKDTTQNQRGRKFDNA